jgi:glycine cleavage system regulatory protein
VLTIVGADRPGLVEAVAGVLRAHGANWMESRMSRLASQFAGILLVSVPSDRLDALRDDLAKLAEEGLAVTVRESGAELVDQPMHAIRLALTGQDRPGIVHQIAHLLAEEGVSIEQLETRCVSASWSGETTFEAQALLRAPPGLPTATLLGMLERLGNELMVDIDLQEARGD